MAGASDKDGVGLLAGASDKDGVGLLAGASDKDGVGLLAGASDKTRADAAAGLPTRLSAADRIRLGLRVAMLLGAVIACVPPHYLFRLFRLPSPWPRLFLGWAARICGARVRRIGTPLRRDVFYVANHLSWIDILALGGASGTAFVAKSEIATSPIVGWLAGAKPHRLCQAREPPGRRRADQRAARCAGRELGDHRLSRGHHHRRQVTAAVQDTDAARARAAPRPE